MVVRKTRLDGNFVDDEEDRDVSQDKKQNPTERNGKAGGLRCFFPTGSDAKAVTLTYK